jgi:hypothetical protein
MNTSKMVFLTVASSDPWETQFEQIESALSETFHVNLSFFGSVALEKKSVK